MDYNEVYDWATEPDKHATLKKQLATAIAIAAVQILAEDPATPNHDTRVAWASKVLAQPTAPLNEADRMIWGVLGNTAVQNALEATGVLSDSDMQWVVASLIGTYSV